MAVRALPTRLHALYVELLRELLARGADRHALERWAREATDLAHEVDALRAPDPRHLEQLAIARAFGKAVATAVRNGYSHGEATSVASKRLGLSRWRLRRVRELAQRPAFTIPPIDGDTL